MADFAKLRKTAERLIEKNGRTVTLTRNGSTPTDAVKEWRGQSTPVVETVAGIGVFVSSEMGKRVDNIADVKRIRQVCLFAAANDGGKQLETFDTITDGALTWRIVGAELLAPASTRMIYQFEVER